jgi:hypothetical protein
LRSFHRVKNKLPVSRHLLPETGSARTGPEEKKRLAKEGTSRS